jgi:hypothetical protein
LSFLLIRVEFALQLFICFFDSLQLVLFLFVTIFELFDLRKNEDLAKTFEAAVQKKTFKTWYFDRQADGVHIRDISSLDAGSDNPVVAQWGGLSEFASRAVDIISKLAAHAEK